MSSADATSPVWIQLSDNRVAGDVLTTAFTAAAFADKNVGTGKTVSVTGISISGTDSIVEFQAEVSHQQEAAIVDKFNRQGVVMEIIPANGHHE